MRRPDICGKLLGKGKTRRVFEHKENSLWVIKVQKKQSKYNNKVEWNFWNAIKDKEFSCLFCPCISLNLEGDLIMMRCEKAKPTIADRMTINLKIRNALGPKPKDVMRQTNFGILDGNLVLIDYGHPQYKRITESIKRAK